MQNWFNFYHQEFLKQLMRVNDVGGHSYVYCDAMMVYQNICRWVLENGVKDVEYKFNLKTDVLFKKVERPITVRIEDNSAVIIKQDYSEAEFIFIIALMKSFLGIDEEIWLPDNPKSLIEGIDDEVHIKDFEERYEGKMPMVTFKSGNQVKLTKWHKYYEED